MSSLLRLTARRVASPRLLNARAGLAAAPHAIRYASKKVSKKNAKDDLLLDEEPVKKAKGPKSTASFVPHSKQKFADEAAQQEYDKAEEKMKAAVEWFRKDCASAEARASGRVTPQLLSPVRVKIEGGEYRLEEVATVGVREGSTLLVTLFDESTMKAVESALYESKLPNIVPQRQDVRTIKIPIPKPTVEARQRLHTEAQRKAEDTRVQLRKQMQTSVKKGKFEKHSVELEEYQKLLDRSIEEVDKTLAQMKKVAGGK
ncbi:ribosome recycling factor domain-containing protein [Schizophyllum commune]